MKKTISRIVIVTALVLVVVAYSKYDLGRYFDLSELKTKQASLKAFYEEHPGTFIFYFLTLYIGSVAASLPIATVLTLAAGSIFGLWTGTALVSIASTVGATLAFWISRFVLGNWVQEKFRDKLAVINAGVEREGAFYLFTLRLVPIFPFFLINLAMALTPIRSAAFFFVSQLAMLPGTIAYVNAGTQLAKIQSLKGILSPGLLFSFAILGLIPLISKKVVDTLRTQRVLKRYKKPAKFDYNTVVIGAGSAGLVSAYIASALKARVALIEKHRMGGDCLNTGCVPSKAFIRSARMLSYAKRAREFGFRDTTVSFDFAEVMERVQSIIKKVEPHDSVERYSGLGVECISGQARITSPYEVQVNGKTLTTKTIIVATGAGPAVPPIEGLQQVDFLTSDTVWNIRTLPKRLLVLGGGPIGCELAQAFARFGASVTLVQAGSRLLPREDEEVSGLIREQFESEGIRVLTDHTAKAFRRETNGSKLICETAGKQIEIEFDRLLLALGRKPNTKGFGLEELGVEISSRGTIASDEFLRTNIPNIFVCGDVAGPYQFTHTAAHQAWFASVNALFSPFKKFKVDYRVIPWSTFVDPEVARVGLNELEAKERGIAYEVTTYGLDDLDRAIADSEDHGLVKVLTVPGKDRVLGATIVGSHAGDFITEYIAAMKHGFGLNKILGTIHIYPTLGEANRYVAGNWKRAHAPQGALQFLQKFHQWRRGGTVANGGDPSVVHREEESKRASSV